MRTVLCLGLWLLAGVAPARAGYLCRQVHHPEAGLRWKPAAGLFMSLRTNPRHYWAFSRRLADGAPAERAPLFAEGLIAGDFHYQNLAARRADGRLKIDFMDLDDGGRGPFVFDFARFLVTARAIDRKLDEGVLVDAYTRGLRGKKDDKPARLADVTRLTAKKIAKRDREFLEKNTDGDALNFARLELTRREESTERERALIDGTAAELGRIFDAAVLSAASRRRADGGSQGFLRVWALLRGEGGARIFEAKELGEPALGFWSPQKDAAERLPELMDVYWGERSADYGILKNGGRNFWFRPRAKKHFRTDLPAEGDRAGRRRLEAEMAYFANYLGRRHGAQEAAAPYRRLVEESPEAFREALRDFAEAHDREVRRQYAEQDLP